jgi:hypothetical protein
MSLIKVKDEESLVRDSSSNALINTNLNDYQNFVKQREMARIHRATLEETQLDLMKLKGTISELDKKMNMIIQMLTTKD